MACGLDSRCTLGTFTAYGSVAAHVRYRPPFACVDFALALAQNSREIFHPIKSRRCVAAYLDARALGGLRPRGGTIAKDVIARHNWTDSDHHALQEVYHKMEQHRVFDALDVPFKLEKKPHITSAVVSLNQRRRW